jgi:protein pelota
MADVCDAIDYGAAETIVVADTEIRDEKNAQMIETAERLNTDIVVLSTEFEPGKRLLGLGGIAALLRYKIAG